jgi:dinuclear metal center YbgI/SA1388 family protein
MIDLHTLAAWCDGQTLSAMVRDFPGAHNGLQCSNKSGTVSRLAVAVDSHQGVIDQAIAQGADALLVHHGLFWEAAGYLPWTGKPFAKLQALLDHNLAVLSYHLPLDAHPQLGNNAQIAQRLGLTPSSWEVPYEGMPMVPVVAQAPAGSDTRSALRAQLHSLFPHTLRLLEAAPSEQLGPIAICSGHASSVLPQLVALGVRTCIVGELRYAMMPFAYEHQLNVYVCGHYASETFGVSALAQAIHTHWGLPYVFIHHPFPL